MLLDGGVDIDDDIERFVKQHEVLMHGFVQRRLPHGGVDDVVQSVFVAVWRSEQEDEAIIHASFAVQRAWLCRAALFEIAAYRRAQGRAERLKERFLSYRRITDVHVDDRNEADTPLDRACARMTNEDQEILTAVFHDGFSNAEIALLYGCKEAAVRQRLSRAIRHLRVLYAQERKRR